MIRYHLNVTNDFNHGRQKPVTDNRVGGARHCLQTMGAPNFIVRAERSAAHDFNKKFV